jgi:hypothetical protein
MRNGGAKQRIVGKMGDCGKNEQSFYPSAFWVVAGGWGMRSLFSIHKERCP